MRCFYNNRTFAALWNRWNESITGLRYLYQFGPSSTCNKTITGLRYLYNSALRNAADFPDPTKGEPIPVPSFNNKEEYRRPEI